jgi:hypothetical protein
MSSVARILFIIVLLLYICSFAVFSQENTIELENSQKSWQLKLRSATPELGLVGYSSYLTISGAINLSNLIPSNETQRAYRTMYPLTGAFLLGSSLVLSINNLFINDPTAQKVITTISRIGYIAAIITPILWSTFDPSADGDERFNMGFRVVLPAATGLFFSFLKI